MDLDLFITERRPSWERLRTLVRRHRRLTGEEVDELVELYQRVATDLSVLRSAGHDPALAGWLSGLVARARAVITGAHAGSWRDFTRFFTRVFPATLYRLRWWWLGMTAGTVGIAAAVAWWIVADPAVMHAMGTPEYVAQVVEYEFANYYVENPRGSFAAQVWTNNAWVAAQAILYGVAFGVPTLYVMLLNALNLGAMAGLMIGHGRADVFFGLILPHGLLELTAVFVAGGIGLRLGWSLIAPGDRTRLRAFAEEGRSAVAAALGLAVVLFISGLIEGLVTGNTVAGHIPIPVALGIGVLAEVLFLLYVFVVGRRAHLEGETGDIRNAPAAVPVA